MTWTPAWMWSLGLAGLGLLAFTAISAWAAGAGAVYGPLG